MGAAALLSPRNVQGRFFHRLEETERALWVPRIAFLATSDQDAEDYVWLGESPKMREWIGNRQKREPRGYSYTIRNRKFENTLEVSVDDLRRDKTAQLDARIGELAYEAAKLPQQIISDLIIANSTAFDGTAFYSDSRTKGDGSITIDNNISVSATTPANPTTEEMQNAILGCIQQMKGFKTDEGEPMNEDAMRFVAMVPTNMWASAVAATKNLYLANGVTNTIPNSGVQIHVQVNPRLTATDQIHVFREDADIKAFIWQDEVPTQIQIVGAGSENEFLRDTHLFGTKRLCNGGYGRPEMAVRCTFT